MTPKEKLEFIRKYIPGTYAELAVKVGCHSQTLHNLKAGKEVNDDILAGLGGLYQQAVTVQNALGGNNE
jgi:hypothetical protein